MVKNAEEWQILVTHNLDLTALPPSVGQFGNQEPTRTNTSFNRYQNRANAEPQRRNSSEESGDSTCSGDRRETENLTNKEAS
jgi:hypothetical protein